MTLTRQPRRRDLCRRFKNAIREDTVLVSVIAVNNEIGSMQPLAEMSTLLKNIQIFTFMWMQCRH